MSVNPSAVNPGSGGPSAAAPGPIAPVPSTPGRRPPRLPARPRAECRPSPASPNWKRAYSPTGTRITPSASRCASPAGQRVRLLRRAPVRQRPASLRAPDHGLRQGRDPAVADDAGQAGRAQVRLGLPRPARGGRGRAAAWHLGQGRDPGDGHREVQRSLPRIGAAVHPRVARLRDPPGPLGRLRQRLQDARHLLHGERHVGFQAVVGQGPDLRGFQGPAVLLAVRDAALQPRTADGRRRLQGPAGPVGDGPVQAGDRRMAAGVDDDAVDAPVQRGRRRRRRHQLHHPGKGRRPLHPGP